MDPKQSINFPNGNQAQYIKAPADAQVSDVLKELDIKQPNALILLFGGVDGLESHIFSWSKIKGDDEGRLKAFLEKRFGITWAKNSKIEKTNDDNTINVSAGKKYLSLSLDKKANKATLKINDGRTDEFTAKAENGEIGIYDESIKKCLVQIFNRVIVPIAADTESMVIDRGTKDGVTELIGQSCADRDRKPVLMGIVPGGMIPDEPAMQAFLDPNHSNFIIVEGNNWGDETKSLINIAKTLARGIPVIIVLANGDDIAKKEVLLCVRQGWPIIVIEESGGLADEIANFKKFSEYEKCNNLKKDYSVEKPSFLEKLLFIKKKQKPPCIRDPEMAEIIADGHIQCYPLDGRIQDFRKMIISHLNPTLEQAWERFALFDDNAVQQQKNFDKLQVSILALGVFAAALAVGQEFFKLTGNEAVKDILLIITTIISILVVGANRLRPGNKWLLLRASAENIKRKIYCYRTRVGKRYLFSWDNPEKDIERIKKFLKEDLGIECTEEPQIRKAANDNDKFTICIGNASIDIVFDREKKNVTLKFIDGRTCDLQLKEENGKVGIYSKQMTETSRRDILASSLEDVNLRLMQTEVNHSALRNYKGEIPPKKAVASIDDGFSLLTPDEYIRVRLDDQLHYYQRSTEREWKRMKKFQLWIIIFSGAGTLLAAVGWQLWIALTATLAGTFTTYIEYRQVENSIIKYNQTATYLENIKNWWAALPPWERANPKNVDFLIEQTEKTLQSELTGWIQQMENALADLRKQQTKEVSNERA